MRRDFALLCFFSFLHSFWINSQGHVFLYTRILSMQKSLPCQTTWVCCFYNCTSPQKIFCWFKDFIGKDPPPPTPQCNILGHFNFPLLQSATIEGLQTLFPSLALLVALFDSCIVHWENTFKKINMGSWGTAFRDSNIFKLNRMLISAIKKFWTVLKKKK